MSDMFPDSKTGSHSAYLVLARKYRPQVFADLIGQEALVRTLSNAIASNRIHHAYVLTGIRGVGKTTTARILAKALNCENGPAIEWADDDASCKSIAEGRHVDVLEFDAASHTKVEEIRDLFEGVNYQPAQSRYKIYIIDEVHMLSKSSFNALLKTLEEPPPHVKFIFATTEVHKIPVTVLSRCQRFDLRRVPVDLLQKHFASLCEKEGVSVSPAALQHIARAAEGSVRDGLSLLDQAIALAGGNTIDEALVGQMLGQAAQDQLFSLLEGLFSQKLEAALGVLNDLYNRGFDPQLVVQDLLALLHLLTRLKVVPNLAQGDSLSEMEKLRAVPLAQKLSLEAVGRAYQILLHAAGESKQADRPLEAVEMALVRAAYLAPVPAVATLMGKAMPDLGTVAVSKPVAIAQTPNEPAPWEDEPAEASAAPKM